MADELSQTDVLAYSRRLAHMEVSVEELQADTSVSAHAKRDIIALALYQIQYEAARRDAKSRRHRRAMALLRSFLSPTQTAELRRNSSFIVLGSLGNYYRLMPRTGMVWRVERRKSRWYYIASYCLHDYAEDDPSFVPIGFPNEGKHSIVPSADRSLAHMLMLLADEADFRRKANEHISISQGWRRGADVIVRLRAERWAIDQQQEIAA